MIKSAVVSARIDPELKTNAEYIFETLGLTTTQAITMFFKQVELNQGLPFEVRVPNEITMQALEDARVRENIESYNTISDLFEDLDI